MSPMLRPGLLLMSIALLVLIGNTSAKVAKLSLPKIYHNDLQLTPQENGYSLRIIMPNGKIRNEIVELINPGTPQQYLAIKATGVKIYPGATDKTSLTSDEIEYLHKYNNVVDTLANIKVPELGALVLKSSTG